MTKQNKKIRLLKCNLADFDAVSLYASAMVELGSTLGGFLKGAPKVITDKSYKFLKEQDGYFVKIKITKVGKHLKMPLLNYINDDGIRTFTNDMIGKEVYIDKIGLEDAIKFQKIKFEIIEGYYFNEGRNGKIKEVIERLFNERLRYKKEGNKIEEVIKLILNSCYGKSILRPIDAEVTIITGKDRFETYMSRHYAYVRETRRISNNKWLVNCCKSINEHYNFAQVGCEILSMSKRIMNRVMCLAEDLNINIYYQDTDSMHLDYDQVKPLSEEYLKLYGKELIGEHLGQFHIDFKLEIEDENGNKQKALPNTIRAVDSIFLGKKSYIDRLEGLDKDGNKMTGYHVRMKGVSRASLDYYCDITDQNIFDVYNRLYNGEEMQFDLTCGGSKFIVKHNKNLSVSTNLKFDRVLKF